MRFRIAMTGAGLFVIKEDRKVIGTQENGKPMYRTAKEYHNPRNLRPDSFRHSLNTLLRDFGYDAGKIRAALGWSDEKVQEGYTDWNAMNYTGQREIVERELG